MNAAHVAALAARLGIGLAEARAVAIAAEVDAIAARVLAGAVRPAFEDEPASFQRATTAPPDGPAGARGGGAA